MNDDAASKDVKPNGASLACVDVANGDEAKEKTPTPPKPARLVSLDALRGFDIFLLFAFDDIASAFREGPGPIFTEQTDFWQAFWRPFDFLIDVPAWAEKSRAFSEAFLNQARHMGWNEGFSILDLVMPLFLFMAGAAIPFALARYLTSDGRKRSAALWIRILRRVAVLWIFGMCAQGNLLDLVPGDVKLYSNTLQAIATGYLFSCVAYLYLPRRGRWALFGGLLASFWALNAFCTLNGCGGGSYDPNGNLAYEVDRLILGRFRNCASVGPDGAVVFNPGYYYTWIISSLTFTATTLSGVFAGEFLRRTRDRLGAISEDDVKFRRRIELRAVATLAISGVVCVVLGRAWGALPEGSVGYCPIVKYIWTPTMTLYASGLSLLLLSFFYWAFDVMQTRILRTFLLVFGANAIAAYMLSHLLRYDELAGWLLHGTEQYVGVWYGTLTHVAGVALIWLFLWDFWRRGKFLRV